MKRLPWTKPIIRQETLRERLARKPHPLTRWRRPLICENTSLLADLAQHARRPETISDLYAALKQRRLDLLQELATVDCGHARLARQTRLMIQRRKLARKQERKILDDNLR